MKNDFVSLLRFLPEVRQALVKESFVSAVIRVYEQRSKSLTKRFIINRISVILCCYHAATRTDMNARLIVPTITVP